MMREETPKRGEPTVKRDVKLVPVGNSKGTRLPKVLLQKYGWSDFLVLEELEEGVFLWELYTKLHTTISPPLYIRRNHEKN